MSEAINLQHILKPLHYRYHLFMSHEKTDIFAESAVKK